MLYFICNVLINNSTTTQALSSLTKDPGGVPDKVLQEETVMLLYSSVFWL